MKCDSLAAAVAVACCTLIGVVAEQHEREMSVETASEAIGQNARGGVCYVDSTFLCPEADIPSCAGNCSVWVSNKRYCDIDTEVDRYRSTVPVYDTGPTGGFAQGFGAQTPCAKNWDCNNTPCTLVNVSGSVPTVRLLKTSIFVRLLGRSSPVVQPVEKRLCRRGTALWQH